DPQGNVAITGREIARDEVTGHEDFERLVNVALDGHPWSVGCRARGADGVDAPDRAADAPAPLAVELVGHAATDLGKRRVEDGVDLAQRRALAEVERRDHRQLGLGEIPQERVFVQDRLARPPAGPVELHHEPPLVLQLHLVHAVLEGAQRQAAAGRAQAADLDGIEHAVGGEGEERGGENTGHDRDYNPPPKGAAPRSTRSAPTASRPGAWPRSRSASGRVTSTARSTRSSPPSCTPRSGR